MVTAALYRLFVKSIATKARVLALLSLGVVAVLVGLAIGRADSTLRDAVDFINGFGLALTAPVVSLVFASSVLGQLVEDQTLVYLWLRPTARWKIVVAAVAAVLTVALPLVVGPLVVAALLTSTTSELVVGTAVAAAVGVVAYGAVFTALGLTARRALVWGLLYVFIWEGFVATAGDTASRVALRSYSRSLLSDITDVSLPRSNVSTVAAVVVPVGVALVAMAFSTYRLRRMDVP